VEGLETVKAAGLSLGEKVRASAIGLRFDEGLDFIEWAKIGSGIGAAIEATAWWIGDWCNYSFWEYGSKYEAALDVTGLDYGTLANIASVCEKVETSRRRENLSFTHHVAVASLPAEEQVAWLDRAEQEKWSTRQLQAALAGARQLPAHEPSIRLTLSLPPAEADRVERWKAAAEADGEDFAEWVGEACDVKAKAYVVLPA
jgi:hypothetical protein